MTNMHEVREQQIVRDRLDADVQAFLKRGGKIEQLPSFAGASPKDDEDDTVMTAIPFGRNYRDL